MPTEILGTIRMGGADPITGWTDTLIRLAVAAAVGSAIGLNRELRDKPAGLRTHMLVAIGSAAMTAVGVELATFGSRVDGNAVARVIQGLVAGIGFIGGGVILHTEGRNVVGLTTAATIWVAAALGVACGAGYWRTAVLTVALALAILVIGNLVEREIHRRGLSTPARAETGDDKD